MSVEQTHATRQLLMTAYPDVYEKLLEALLSNNIHSYDVQLTSLTGSDGVEIQVCFGEDFNQIMTQTFPEKALHETDDDFAAFCEKVADTCKETLIADYFKMVKP